MKKPVYIALALTCLLFMNLSGNKDKNKPVQQGTTVIELFTSEGCSSCPPADRVLSMVKEKEQDKNVLVLSYHVDYWNRLGWKDTFSNAANTQRQEYYAEIFQLSSIYTPQAVVNGSAEFAGSDYGKMKEAIEKENALRRETLIAKRPKQENWTDDEKARMAKIETVIKAISERLKTDPKLVKIATRLKELQAIIDAPEYNIEALTGTWGPEKLPPRA